MFLFKGSSAFPQVLIPCANTVLEKFVIVIGLVVLVFRVLACRAQISCYMRQCGLELEEGSTYAALR